MRTRTEGGRLQPENVGAYGPDPESYKADAIILRNGAALAHVLGADGKTRFLYEIVRK